MPEQGEDRTKYLAVVNDEEQYSIWPEHKTIPAGWRDTGSSGTKSEVLQWIASIWTDMRPLSIRRQWEDLRPKQGTQTNEETRKPGGGK